MVYAVICYWNSEKYCFIGIEKSTCCNFVANDISRENYFSVCFRTAVVLEREQFIIISSP